MKHLILGVIFLFLAGMSKGLSDRINFHSYNLPAWMNENFWDMDNWRNKWALDEYGDPISSEIDHGCCWVRNGTKYYKEKYWGSSRLFVTFTDGWHLCQLLYKIFLTIGSILFAFGFPEMFYESKIKWLKKLWWWFDAKLYRIISITILFTWLIVSLGFEIIYV